VLRVLGIDLAYSVVLFQNFFLSARKKQLAVKQARKEVPPAGNHQFLWLKLQLIYCCDFIQLGLAAWLTKLIYFYTPLQCSL